MEKELKKKNGIELQKIKSMTEEEAKNTSLSGRKKKYEEHIKSRIKKPGSYRRDEFEKRAKEYTCYNLSLTGFFHRFRSYHNNCAYPLRWS